MSDGLGDLFNKAQEMQEQLKKKQDEIANCEVTGESGAGLVKIIMNGRHDVKSVQIDESLLKEDKDILEDLLTAAVNDAVRKIEDKNTDNISNWAAGLNLPEGFKFPFGN